MAYITNEEDFKQFLKYKHSSPKTTLEAFCIDYIYEPIDRLLIPQYLSPNFITFVGQAPMICLNLYMLFTNKD